MPPGETRQLEIIVGTGGLCHFAETEVQSFGQQHVQKPDVIFAGNARPQVCKGFSKTDIIINFLQQIGDPNRRQATIEVKHHVVGCFGHSPGQAIQLENAVFN